MTDATAYELVPTITNENESTTCQPLKKYMGLIFAIVLCLGFALPFILFSVLDFKRHDGFSRQSSLCRVNSVASRGRRNAASVTRIHPEWIADVVKPSESSNGTKELIILLSNVKITGDQDHLSVSSAQEFAARLYPVGKIYPCYIHKKLLDNVSVDYRGKDLKGQIQWETPQPKFALIWLCIIVVLTIMGVVIISVLYCLNS